METLSLTLQKALFENLGKVGENIFSALNCVDTEEHLKNEYRSMLKTCHPDLYESDPKNKAIAEQVTKLLTEHYKAAQKLIGGKNLISKNELNFEIGSNKYSVFIDSGKQKDFYTFYEGICNDKEKTFFKVSNTKEDIPLLKNELNVLKKIKHKSITTCEGGFETKDKKWINIFKQKEEGFNLSELKTRFPNGVPQEHLAWILDRLLSVIGYLHKEKVIVGSITPDSIFVVPSNHNAILTDFTLSILDANTSKAKHLGITEFSSPDLNSTSVPEPADDLFSLGKSISLIVPKKIDDKLSNIVKSLLSVDRKVRSDDAWKLWNELKQARKEVFGSSNQFIEFKVRGEV